MPEDADMLARSIRFMMAAELEAINQYGQIRETTRDKFVRAVLRSIMEEEKKHLGELTAVLYTLTPIDESLISDGMDEAAKFRGIDRGSVDQDTDSQIIQ